MATQKPISTVSYNTESFLKEKLDTWLKAHIIQNYMYIKHKGEDGDKDHIHLRVEPNKKLDPMDLQEQLNEYPAGCKKPLTCRPWRPSKEEDWILYAVHDKQYLKNKYEGGEKNEKIPYEWTDIVVPEFFDMEVAYIRAKAKLKHTTVSIANELQKGTTARDLIQLGENPYVVNSIVRAFQSTDYERLSKEYVDTKSQLDRLIEAVYDFGLSIECDDLGKVILKNVD